MGLFDFFKRKPRPVSGPAQEPVPLYDFNGIISAAHREQEDKQSNYWNFKANETAVFSEQVLTLSDKQKVRFIIECVKQIGYFHQKTKSYSSVDKNYQRSIIADSFMTQLMKSKINWDDTDLHAISNAFLTVRRYSQHDFFCWPGNLLITQIEKAVKQRGVSPELVGTMNTLKTAIQQEGSKWHEKESIKAVERIDRLLFEATNTVDAVKPTWFPGVDEFAAYANDTIKQMKQEEQDHWFRLLQLTHKASGSSPSAKYLDDAKNIFRELGADKFKQVINDWFRFITSLKEKLTQHTSEYNNSTYTYTTSEFLAAPNIDIIKGFIWICVHFHDHTTLFNLSAMAERVYHKIPGKGPAAAAIGNACIYVLGNVKGLDGVGHLSRLRLRIKQSSTQTLIEKFLTQAAKKQGVSVHQIEDMAVDDYGMTNGEKTYDFDNYKARLKISGPGKTELTWFKPDGSIQKSLPLIVKEKFASKLKKIKEISKQVEITSSAQRDRLDRMLKSTRNISWSEFQQHYFSHGLMCSLTHQLIWTFQKDGRKESAIYIDNAWRSPNGLLSFTPDEGTLVALWHPVYHAVNEVQQWRTFLLDHRIAQPLKQAFREVYLLTDAEVNTRTYSNRMAAHILKQHQFNSLAKTRGWKYSLLGAYDHGGNNTIASINLAEYNLKAEFWINEVNATDGTNETGIWLYIATDQVRFTRLESDDVVDLLEVPMLIFSEIMRDVDLFVGVASVGNDPQWRDSGGLPAYRDYWQSFSFGDLTEIAKTRKSMLEKIIPRLKIAKVSEVSEKFLVVKGKLRTYKIHIGSTNILMEPNDQYLCIVPDRSSRNATEKVFLPFEGDSGVSVILSKAFLLADDDKITDSTITSQIKRK